MATLRTQWKTNPGLVASGGAHAALLVLLLVNFVFPTHLEEPSETIAVEMVSESDVNQIMNGEEKQKLLPTPQRRVDKVAALEERNPSPPVAEAKKDTPPPPTPEKANDDPGQDEKKAEAVAVKPAQTPPPPVPAPVVPTPPERPIEKAEAPPKDAPAPPQRPAQTEAPKPPPPEDAEAVAPRPPPRPKVERKEAKEPKPDAKPVKVAKIVPPAPPPPPPRRPEQKPEPRRESLDQVAKLLDQLKPKREEKLRSGNEAKEKARDDFSPDKISALLDREAPQHKGSTGKQLTQLASLGAPTAHADKMSPSMMASIDGWLIDHYNGCWHYFGTGADQAYVPKVRVRLGPDGTLVAKPALLNPPSDANLHSLADSAIRAVNECNPLPIPAWLKPHYEAWRDRTINFDLKDRT
jgi:colicin import membrane protein